MTSTLDGRIVIRMTTRMFTTAALLGAIAAGYASTAAVGSVETDDPPGCVSSAVVDETRRSLEQRVGVRGRPAYGTWVGLRDGRSAEGWLLRYPRCGGGRAFVYLLRIVDDGRPFRVAIDRGHDATYFTHPSDRRLDHARLRGVRPWRAPIRPGV